MKKDCTNCENINFINLDEKCYTCKDLDSQISKCIDIKFKLDDVKLFKYNDIEYQRFDFPVI